MKTLLAGLPPTRSASTQTEMSKVKMKQIIGFKIIIEPPIMSGPRVCELEAESYH